MDNLAREAMLARQARMSYGKWKAMQEPVKPQKKEVPDGWKGCEYCGKYFSPKQGKRFCDIECRNMAYKEKDKAIQKKYRERKKANG